MNETLTPIEAGLYLNIHVRTIYRLAKKGMVPARKFGGRWRFSKAALDEWLLEDSVQRRDCDKPCQPQFHIRKREKVKHESGRDTHEMVTRDCVDQALGRNTNCSLDRG